MAPIRNYEALIAKTLTQASGKKLSANEVAKMIIDKIEDVESVIGSMGGDAMPILPSYLDGLPKLMRTSEPQRKPAESSNIFRRLGAPDTDLDPALNLIEAFSKEDLQNFAKTEMPDFITVQPPDFAEPFRMERKIESAPGDLGFVRIIYQQVGNALATQDGALIGPSVQVQTTDQSLDADLLVKEIITQANGLYTKTPRVLTPKINFVPRETLYDFANGIDGGTF